MWLRLLFMIPGAIFVFLGICLQPFVSSLAGTIALGICSVLGLIILVRMFRLGVILHEGHLVVRGVLASRRIDRTAITHVRDECFIDWEGEKTQGMHSTPVTAFMTTASASDTGFGPRLARESMSKIRTWAD